MSDVSAKKVIEHFLNEEVETINIDEAGHLIEALKTAGYVIIPQKDLNSLPSEWRDYLSKAGIH